MKLVRKVFLFGLISSFFFLRLDPSRAGTNSLSDTIEKIKPAIVAVGTYQKTRRPPAIFRGTGFVVADGLFVVTNAHVLPDKIDTDKREHIAVFAGVGEKADVREATTVATDFDHDLAVLKITGPRFQRWFWGIQPVCAKVSPMPSLVSHSGWSLASIR